MNFLLKLGLLSVFTFLIPSTLFSQQTVDPLTIEYSEPGGGTQEKAEMTYSPKIIGVTDEHIWLTYYQMASLFNTNVKLYIEKRRLEDHHLLFTHEVDLDEEYLDFDLLYEDVFASEDGAHVIFRTEKEDEDSVYLVECLVTGEEEISDPRPLIASWVEDDKDNNNLSYLWNEDKTELCVSSMVKSSSGTAMIRKRTYSRTFQLLSTENYDLEKPFDQVSIVTDLYASNNLYQFILIRDEEGGTTSTGVVEYSNGHARIAQASVRHPEVRGIRLAMIGDDLILCYMTMENAYDDILGYQGSRVVFDGEQEWVTDLELDEETRDDAANNYFFNRSDRGNWSIQTIAESSTGNYAVVLHKTYNLVEKRGELGTYFSYDPIIILLDSNHQVLGYHHTPIYRQFYYNRSMIYPFSGFTEDGSFFMYMQSFRGGAKELEEDGEHKPGFGQYSECILEIRLSPDGTSEYQEEHCGDRELFMMSSKGFYRIGNSNEFYTYSSTRDGFGLKIVTLYGLDEDAVMPTFRDLQYGDQE